MGIETAILGSAVIGAGSSIFGASKAEKAAKNAAKLQARQFAETKESLSPYMKAGESGLDAYRTSIGLNGQDRQQEFFDQFQYDPGFQKFLDDSNTNAMRSYSLYGDTGGNLANQLRKNSESAIYGQFQDRRNAFAGLADSGRAAATALGGIGSGSAANQGNLIAGAGQIAGQGIINAGNAFAGGLSNYAGYGQYKQGLAAGGSPWAAQTVNYMG